MRNLPALALGLLVVGLGLYGASAVTPIAFPAAFNAQGHTTNLLALIVMLAITEVSMMFAGWLVARTVADHRAGHALLLATMALATAMFTGSIRWAAAPAWYHVVSWALLLPAAMLGVRAWERSLRRRSRSLSPRMIAS